MKAYRINITGTKEHYLVTERQKNAIDKVLDDSKNSFLAINGDRIRTSMIKSIQFVNVDLEGCPDYFVERVKQENSGGLPGQLSDEEKKLRRMPSAWILLDENMKPVVEKGDYVLGANRTILYPGGEKYWYLAKCHYHYEKKNGKESVTDYVIAPIKNIAELLKVRDDPECPGVECVSDKWVYGEKSNISGK